MPYVLLWNRTAIDERMQRLAAWLGLADRSFDGVFDWILALRAEIGIPNTLADLGLRDEHAPAFAPQAYADPSTGGNPVAMQTGDFEDLYRMAIHGDLTRRA
jgi:alcohol dehydrogenase class IV